MTGQCVISRISPIESERHWVSLEEPATEKKEGSSGVRNKDMAFGQLAFGDVRLFSGFL